MVGTIVTISLDLRLHFAQRIVFDTRFTQMDSEYTRAGMFVMVP